jgi:hypothetical protein
MKHPCEISVKGKALIQCICGKVSVLGYQIEAGNQKRSIYCPSSASFLTVSTVNDQTVNYNGHFTDCRKLELELKPFLSDYPTVVLLQSFNCHQTDFIMQHDKFNDLYQELAVSNVTPSSVDSVSVPQTLLETGESWLADIKNGRCLQMLST